MDEKRKEMEPLQQALGKLRGPAGSRERASSICSSEEELNDLVRFYLTVFFVIFLQYVLHQFFICYCQDCVANNFFIAEWHSLKVCNTVFSTKAFLSLKKNKSLGKSNSSKVRGKRLLQMQLRGQGFRTHQVKKKPFRTRSK